MMRWGLLRDVLAAGLLTVAAGCTVALLLQLGLHGLYGLLALALVAVVLGVAALLVGRWDPDRAIALRELREVRREQAAGPQPVAGDAARPVRMPRLPRDESRP